MLQAINLRDLVFLVQDKRAWCFRCYPRRRVVFASAVRQEDFECCCFRCQARRLVSLRSVHWCVGTRATQTILRIFKDVKTTQYSTQPAAHSQDTNTGRGKGEDGDYDERRREDGNLPFPKLKSLYYYWPLIILIYLTECLSNNKQGKLGIAP